MAYAWTSDLETGNAKIDLQHKELILAINSLLEACSKGQGRKEVENTLNFLNNYIIRHFNDEEVLQKMSGYPDIVNHKKYHETFKKTVADIATEFHTSGATIPLVAKANTSIGAWLINHIKKEDVKVAAHLKLKGFA